MTLSCSYVVVLGLKPATAHCYHYMYMVSVQLTAEILCKSRRVECT